MGAMCPRWKPCSWDYGFVAGFTGREEEALWEQDSALSDRETRPTDKCEILTVVHGVRDIYTMTWGLIPNWAAKPPKPPLYNARGETVDVKPSFRSAFAARRGVFSAAYYVEFVNRQPLKIRQSDHEALYIGAIWDEWVDPHAQQPILSCSMVTIFPNNQVEPLHDRMPVILEPDDVEQWITGTADEARQLIRPWPHLLDIQGQSDLFSEVSRSS